MLTLKQTVIPSAHGCRLIDAYTLINGVDAARTNADYHADSIKASRALVLYIESLEHRRAKWVARWHNGVSYKTVLAIKAKPISNTSDKLMQALAHSLHPDSEVSPEVARNNLCKRVASLEVSARKWASIVQNEPGLGW